jgi:hypothetical protein
MTAVEKAFHTVSPSTSPQSWYSTILAFPWRDKGKPRKISVRISGVRVEIRTEHLLNGNDKRVAKQRRVK